MGARTPLPKITIKGEKHAVYVDDAGLFSDEEEQYTAPTLDALKTKLTSVANKKKVAIEATLITVGGWRRGRTADQTPIFENVTVTGWHSRNRTPLLRDENGKPITGVSYNSNVIQRLTAEEVDQALALAKALGDAEKAWQTWRNDHDLDVLHVLREAGLSV